MRKRRSGREETVEEEKGGREEADKEKKEGQGGSR